MATIATLAINLIGNASGLKSALTDAQSSIKATADSLKSVGSKMTAAVSLPIIGVAGAALKGAAEMEQLEVAFTTMLKSGEAAKSLIADLTEFSAATPFELPEVVNAGKMLLAYGVEANNVKGTLRQLGDVAAGVGAPIGDIAYLFGTARVQGRLFSADINQFTNRGIPIITALAKTMGVAEGSIKKMAEEGKIGFAELQGALDYLTTNGGQFEGLMAAQSETLAGLFSTLKDNVGITLATIGRSIVEAFDLRSKLGSALEVLGQVKEFIVNLAQTNPALLKTAVIIAAVAASIGPLLVGLGMVVGVIGNLIPVIGALSSAFAFLVSPLGLAIAGLGALFYFDVGGIRTKFMELAASIWEFGSQTTSAFSNYRAVVLDAGFGSIEAQEAISLFPESLQGVLGFVDNLIGAFNNYRAVVLDAGFGSIEAQEAISLFPESLQGVIGFVGNLIGAFTNYRAVVLDAGLGSIEAQEAISLFPQSLQGVISAVATAWASVGPTFTQMWTWLQINIPMALATVQAWSTTAWSAVSGAVAAAWAVIGPPLQTMWSWLQVNIPMALAAVQAAFTTAWSAAPSALTQAWATMSGTLTQMWTWLQINIPMALATAQQWFTTAWTNAPGALSTAWTTMLSTFTQMVTWFNVTIPASLLAAQTWFVSSWAGINGAVAQAWATMQPVFDQISAAWSAIVALFSPSIARLRASFGEMVSGFGELGPSFAALQEAVMSTITALTPAVQVFGMVIAGTLGAIGVFAIDTLGAAFRALPGVVQVVVDQITAALNLLTTVISGGIQIIDGLLTGDFTAAWEGVKTVVGGVATYVETTMGNLGGTVLLAFSLISNALITTFADLATSLGLDSLAAKLEGFNTSVNTVVTNVKSSVSGAWLTIKETITLTVSEFAWTDYVDALVWPLATINGFVWETFVSALTWPMTVISAFTWGTFVKALSWPDAIKGFSWSSFVPELTWPEIPQVPQDWWKSLDPRTWFAPRTNALGTSYWGGGVTLVGESGPELAVLPRGTQIIPHQESMSMMAAGGGAAVVVQNMNVRNEADIYRLAYAVDDLRRRRRRG
jgi:tape measure domain-containing protein